MLYFLKEAATLESLSEDIFDFNSLEDLENWLR
ncbi:MAG: DUF4351 domain-containing protein [Symploca sp. SIO1C2]|nr:DUF4351 domain-containing protein [Symploca sp. SIO1C2]